MAGVFGHVLILSSGFALFPAQYALLREHPDHALIPFRRQVQALAGTARVKASVFVLKGSMQVDKCIRVRCSAPALAQSSGGVTWATSSIVASSAVPLTGNALLANMRSV